MASVKLYNLEGKETGSVTLDDAVFAVKPLPELVQFVLTAQDANAFQPYAHTKTRGERAGGGKKPWRQKGTGRARHGSTRSPIWRKGGVTHGPRSDRNLNLKVNKKQRRKALKMVLSDKAANSQLLVVEGWDGLEGKTKQLATLLAKLPVGDRSVLITSGAKNEPLMRAAGNLANAQTIMADSLNVGDLMRSQYLLIDQAGVDTVTKWLK
jgi:large subunit ribosomal protein L4